MPAPNPKLVKSAPQPEPNQITLCRECECPLDRGPHLHSQQCVKALRHYMDAFRDTIFMLAKNSKEERQERNNNQRMIWELVQTIGGSVTIPDKSAFTPPANHFHRLKMKRNQDNTGFVLESITECEPGQA